MFMNIDLPGRSTTVRPSATRSTSGTSAGAAQRGRAAAAARRHRRARRAAALHDRRFRPFMRALLHAIAVMGVDHVGLGADWDGGGGVIGMEDVAAAAADHRPAAARRAVARPTSPRSWAAICCACCARSRRAPQRAERRASFARARRLGSPRGGMQEQSRSMDRIPVQPEHARPAPSRRADWSLAGRQDWAATPLGPVESWPQSLRTAAEHRARLDRADVHRLGAGPADALQRRLCRDPRRPRPRLRPAGARDLGRRLGADRAQCRARAGRRDPVLRIRAADAAARRRREPSG